MRDGRPINLVRARAAGAGALLCIAAAAGGQVRQNAAQPQPLNPANLQRVDPGVGDIDPLRASLRDLSVDLRGSGDFSSIYRLPGTTPGGSDERFVRFGGGTTAVFPRSVYAQSGAGLGAEIPPGTVFYIGGVPAMQPWERPLTGMGLPRATTPLPPPASAPRADMMLNTAARTDAALLDGPGEDDAAAPAEVGVRQLLRRAAAAPDPGIQTR